MPNGIDKNWVRMCAAIDGFRVRYGSWPTRIRLPEGAIEYLFSAETFSRLGQMIEFIYDGSPFIAEDETGGSYNYGQEGFSNQPPDIPASEWLGVELDSEMVKEYYAPRSGAPGAMEKKKEVGIDDDKEPNTVDEEPLPIGLAIALRSLVGGFFIVPALLLIGSSLGVMDVIPWASRIPVWLSLLIGLPFIAMGAMIASGLRSFGEEDKSVSPGIKLVLLLTFLLPLAFMFLWAGFGPGERNFQAETTFGSHSVSGPGDELTGRIVFGCSGIFMTAVAFFYARAHFTRRNRR